MPRTITVTKRKLNNQQTGIDISVPSHESASSPKLVKHYHVVVITKLPFHKLPEHSEEDIVQFMVPRDYAAFENLQKELLESFPELKLPDLPRKFHLFVNQGDIDERQVAFDCLMKVLAKKKELCTSVPMLRFLGCELLADRNYYKQRREFLQKREEEALETKRKDEALFGSQSEGADQKTELFPSDQKTELFPSDHGDTDLFQEISTDKSTEYTATSLFDDGDSSSAPRRAAKLSLLQEDSEELFIPTEARAEGVGQSVFETDDNSDLLNVSEDLDDVLKIVQDKGRSKKPAAKKLPPMVLGSSKAKASGGLFDSDDTTDIPEMGTDDIMKYIQQNQEAAGDDLDLFSN